MSTTATSLTHTSAANRPAAGQPWRWALAIGGLFVLLHWHFIWRTLRIAMAEGNWSHALAIPFISAYFIHQRRDDWAALRREVWWPGLGILFVGLFGFAFWIYPGRNDMFQGYCMIISLFGLATFLFGKQSLRVLWLPIAYLAFAVKVSDRIWEQVAINLQWVAAKASTVTLTLLGLVFEFTATSRGTTIDLSFRRNGSLVTEGLNVAEACSGLRMLMAFVALGVAMAYLSERRWWQRAVMLAMAIPIAVAVNVGRVTIIGLLYLYNRDLATGDTHMWVGMFMLIPAAGLFWVLGWVLDRIVIYDDPDPPARSRPKPSDRSTAPPPPEPGPDDGRLITKGLTTGAAGTLMLGVAYTLVLATIRPDLLGEHLGRPIAVSALGLVLAGLGGAFVYGRRLLGVSGAEPAFARGVATGVLLAAVLGLGGVVSATQTVLIKQPIPLRRPLYQVPERLGTWQMVDDAPPLSEDQYEALGTRLQFTRVYVDTSMPPGAPGAEARLHVAYYTGNPDTVPHVPERCYTAGGLTGLAKGAVTIALTGPQYERGEAGWTAHATPGSPGVGMPDVRFDATSFTFADPNAPRRTGRTHNVIYFFAANGKFLRGPNQVRALGFDPRDRYAYYCKVEVMLPQVEDEALAAARASAFLSQAMPHVMTCLPDWAALE